VRSSWTGDAAAAVAVAGTFRFSDSGELTLTLDRPCRRIAGAYVTARWCDEELLDAIAVIAVTPWGRRVRGAWTDAQQLVFRVDWTATGVDPLADNATELVARPWMISTALWTPTRAEASRILKLISNATRTEPDLIRGGMAPDLQVTAFDLAEGGFRAGGEAMLRLGIANRGAGTAYRVIATTRSSIATLHGQRMGFGMIKPGTTKYRTLLLTVPPWETAEDTMLVVAFTEGNDFTPGNASRRFMIKRSQTEPVLHLQCVILGRGESPLELNAGELVVLRCTVNNTGTAAAEVAIEIAIAGVTSHNSVGQSIAVRGRAVFDVPLVVPRDLLIDSYVELAVTARDAVFLRTARTSIVGVVRRPRLCTAGQLTREQYHAKLAELRAAVAAGDLTSVQLDRYDAELVACLP
jgi:hypothetical protein